mgnify:CR=1 FL=1
MIDVYPFAGYPVALYGLDEAGLFTAKALYAGEAELSAWDNDVDNRTLSEQAGITPVDFSDNDLREFTTLVVSAEAWKKDTAAKQLAARALEQNLEVICDVELLARTQREASFVGIAGSGGKSLTAALVTYIMQVTGREAEMAGVSGSSALNTDPLGMEGAYIAEMTSFRLDHTVSITFDVATLLNLDSEDDIENTMQIFHRQTEPRAAVVNVDDKPSQIIFNKLSKAGEQRVFPFSTTKPVKGGAFVADGTLYDSFDEGEPVPVMNLSSIQEFAGPHTQSNVAAAFTTVRAIGVEPHQAMAAINSFPGLVGHREIIEKIDGVLYINDAASSSLACVASSFQGYEKIHWIGGGETEIVLANLSVLDSVLDRISKVYLIGSAGHDLATVLNDKLPVTVYDNLEEATAAARHEALESGGGVVMYAPGCKSDDTGDIFRNLVEDFPGNRDDEEE